MKVVSSVLDTRSGGFRGGPGWGTLLFGWQLRLRLQEERVREGEEERAQERPRTPEGAPSLTWGPVTLWLPISHCSSWEAADVPRLTDLEQV